MFPIVKRNFLSPKLFKEVFQDSKKSRDSAILEENITEEKNGYLFYRMSKYQSIDPGEKADWFLDIWKKIKDVSLKYQYHNTCFQLMKFNHLNAASFVYRNKNSDRDILHHNDIGGSENWEGIFLAACIYLNKPFGGDFGWIDENEEKHRLKIEENMLCIIPGGMEHKIYHINTGERVSLNMDFTI